LDKYALLIFIIDIIKKTHGRITLLVLTYIRWDNFFSAYMVPTIPKIAPGIIVINQIFTMVFEDE
jgi:hypothetical protein